MNKWWMTWWSRNYTTLKWMTKSTKTHLVRQIPLAENVTTPLWHRYQVQQNIHHMWNLYRHHFNLSKGYLPQMDIWRHVMNKISPVLSYLMQQTVCFYFSNCLYVIFPVAQVLHFNSINGAISECCNPVIVFHERSAFWTTFSKQWIFVYRMIVIWKPLYNCCKLVFRPVNW